MMQALKTTKTTNLFSVFFCFFFTKSFFFFSIHNANLLRRGSATWTVPPRSCHGSLLSGAALLSSADASNRRQAGGCACNNGSLCANCCLVLPEGRPTAPGSWRRGGNESKFQHFFHYRDEKSRNGLKCWADSMKVSCDILQNATKWTFPRSAFWDNDTSWPTNPINREQLQWAGISTAQRVFKITLLLLKGT